MHHAPVVLFGIDAAGVITLSEGAGLRGMGLRWASWSGGRRFELYRDDPPILGDIRRALAGESVTETVEMGEAFSRARSPRCATGTAW